MTKWKKYDFEIEKMLILYIRLIVISTILFHSISITNRGNI